LLLAPSSTPHSLTFIRSHSYTHSSQVALHEGKLAKSLAAHRNVEKGMVSREEAYHNLRTSMARTVQANFTKYMVGG
jgi:hypothetical protein